MPMVTFFKTIDVSRLTRISRRTGLKFNMLMCYCIGMAASGVKEFYMLPVGEKLIEYLAILFVNDVVSQKDFAKHLDYAIMSANFILVRNE